MSCPGIGVSLTGHYLTLDETCRLARLADDAGFEALLVDGDETVVQRRPAAPLYDAGVLAAAALSARSSRTNDNRTETCAGRRRPLFPW